MNHINIPDELKTSFQRLVPYLPVTMRDDPRALESILIYLKAGGEKLARIAIEAYKQNQRLNQAEAQKRLREQALAIDSAVQLENEEDPEEEGEEVENPDHGEDDF